jgi:hypothetical protein
MQGHELDMAKRITNLELAVKSMSNLTDVEKYPRRWEYRETVTRLENKIKDLEYKITDMDEQLRVRLGDTHDYSSTGIEPRLNLLNSQLTSLLTMPHYEQNALGDRLRRLDNCEVQIRSLASSSVAPSYVGPSEPPRYSEVP